MTLLEQQHPITSTQLRIYTQSQSNTIVMFQ